MDDASEPRFSPEFEKYALLLLRACKEIGANRDVLLEHPIFAKLVERERDSDANVPNVNDETATVAQLKRVVADFAAERNWQKFHTPKNLATSVAIEAAELMEIFQWLTPDESYDVKNDPEKMIMIGDEIADVASYLFELCNALGIDFASEFIRKSKKNAIKYPIDGSRDA